MTQNDALRYYGGGNERETSKFSFGGYVQGTPLITLIGNEWNDTGMPECRIAVAINNLPSSQLSPKKYIVPVHDNKIMFHQKTGFNDDTSFLKICLEEYKDKKCLRKRKKEKIWKN